MPFKREDSPHWYADYTSADGRRVKRSTETTSLSEARELEAKWRLEAREQRLWGTQPSRSFKELIARYLDDFEDVKRSIWRDAISVMRLREFFPDDRELRSIKRADVRAYIQHRKAQGVTAGTINREIGLLSSMFNHARFEWDWDIPNPATNQKMREPEGRKRFLTAEQASCLMRVASENKRAPYLADMILLAVNTGMRRGELLGLTWSRVDLKANTLQLGEKDTKSGKSRLVPLNSQARSALLCRASYRAEHCPDAPNVFCTKSGEGLDGIKSSWTKAVKQAGLEDFHFHDLRHTAGSWLAQAGVPLKDIAEILGHSTLKMTERYTHLAPENLRAAVDKLAMSQSRTQ